jgi:hypothetical protein
VERGLVPDDPNLEMAVQSVTGQGQYERLTALLQRLGESGYKLPIRVRPAPFRRRLTYQWLTLVGGAADIGDDGGGSDAGAASQGRCPCDQRHAVGASRRERGPSTTPTPSQPRSTGACASCPAFPAARFCGA